MIMIYIMKKDSYLLVMVVVLIIVVAAGSLHFPSLHHFYSPPLSNYCVSNVIPLYSFKAKIHFIYFISILSNTLLSASLLFVVLENSTSEFHTALCLISKIIHPKIILVENSEYTINFRIY